MFLKHDIESWVAKKKRGIYIDISLTMGFILPEQSRLNTRAWSSLYVIQAFEFGMKSYAPRRDCFDLPTPPTAASRQIKAHHHGNALIHWGQRESLFKLRDFRGKCLPVFYKLQSLNVNPDGILPPCVQKGLYGWMILAPLLPLFTDMSCFACSFEPRLSTA